MYETQFPERDRVQCSLDVILRNYCIGVGGKIVKIQFETKSQAGLKLKQYQLETFGSRQGGGDGIFSLKVENIDRSLTQSLHFHV